MFVYSCSIQESVKSFSVLVRCDQLDSKIFRQGILVSLSLLRELSGFNTSTNHVLALASQSVGIMITLIPLLKECVRRCMAEKQVVLLSEFDRMLKDYQNHQGEIHAKLIAIMNERFDVHMKSMQVSGLRPDLERNYAMHRLTEWLTDDELGCTKQKRQIPKCVHGNSGKGNHYITQSFEQISSTA